jgi:Tfp pilus assembly protein PilN
MLRTNLSTRPFYNERAVHLLLVLAALLVVGVTAYNVREVITLRRVHNERNNRADELERQAAADDKKAAEIRSGLNTRELEDVALASREANAIIDRRTFSWTELFNRIETTLPPEVMVTSVRPDIREGVVSVSIVVLSEDIEDIDTFIENLEATKAFEGVLSSEVEATEDGMYRAALRGRYVSAAPPPEEAPEQR